MRTVKEIDALLTEKRALLASDGEIENIDAVEAAVNGLLEERKQAVTAIEKRKKLLGDIATGATGVEVRHAAAAVELASELDADESDPAARKEYRTAFYKHMTGRAMNERETRAFNAALEARAGMTSAPGGAGPAIPTQLNADIVQKVKQIAPMLDEITLLRINGNVKIAAEGTIAEAGAHAENATISGDSDKLVEVVLGGYEITKLVTISKTVRTMSQGNFEAWLVEMIAKRVARKIEAYIVNGTGTNEPQGVAAAATWKENDNMLTVKAADTLTAANINAAIAMLNGEYDYNAKILMSKKTLFTDFMPLVDKSKNDVVRVEGKNYFVQGYPVLLSDSVKLHDAYIGSFTEIYGNLAQDITVESNTSSGFRQNAIDYLGSALFDCKPAVAEAFVKITKATA